MHQAPNVFIIAFADTTITFGWNIPGDTPDAIKILRASPSPVVFGEFTPNDQGFFWSQFQDTGLQSGTLYTYEVCCEYHQTNETLCGTAAQQTSGVAPPPPIPTMTITSAQGQPQLLVFHGGVYDVQPNGINLSWVSSVPVQGLNVECTLASGGPTGGINIGGSDFPASSGSTLKQMPTKGIPYNVRMRGAFNSNWTTWSQTVQVTDPFNFRSLRGFLAASGLNGSNGIRQFLPKGVTSLRYIVGD